MSAELLSAIRNAMRPVAERFALRVMREQDERSYTEVLYGSRDVGLSVAIDWSEFRPFLRLYELTDGQLPMEQPSYVSSSRLSSFDVDDLLLLRAGPKSPVGKMLGERNDAAAERLIAEYATSLEQHAADVLSGDFTVFSELDQIVKARNQEMRGRAR